jgi:hypothetical protein
VIQAYWPVKVGGHVWPSGSDTGLLASEGRRTCVAEFLVFSLVLSLFGVFWFLFLVSAVRAAVCSRVL